MELADTLALGASSERNTGSSPVGGTIYMFTKTKRQRVREKLEKILIVQGIATGLDSEGFYFIARISKKDNNHIPLQIEGIPIHIRYVEND